MKIGLLQVRGLGDILIALPIARWYFEQGHEIQWPIMSSYLRCFEETVPWVKWQSVPPDSTGEYLYEVPLKLLGAQVDRVICLYHHLATTPGFAPDPAASAVLKFDQYKYAVANVPFSQKWNLARCIVRNAGREQQLYREVVRQQPYVVVHLNGSDERRSFDSSAAVARGYQIIEITERTDCIFDWLAVLEGAGILALVDSVFSNLVDQLGIGATIPKMFLRRSHNQIGWTPVMLGNWRYL